MTQDPGTDDSFHVDSGESVTVTVTPFHCANLSDAVFNGTVVSQTPANSGIYSFTVDGTSADTESNPFTFVCRCHFISSTPTTAYYSVSARGADGKSFPGPTVYVSVPEVTFTLDFAIN